MTIADSLTSELFKVLIQILTKLTTVLEGPIFNSNVWGDGRGGFIIKQQRVARWMPFTFSNVSKIFTRELHPDRREFTDGDWSGGSQIISLAVSLQRNHLQGNSSV